jgi:hypothetical protein
MDVDGLIRMQPAGVLHRVRFDREMVHLTEENGVAELAADHLGEDTPALRRRVEVAVVGDRSAGGHHQSAALAAGFGGIGGH